MGAEAKKLVSEFVGTFLLVFTVGCNTVATASGTWAALSIASVLMVSIYALGGVSGGHFNPAVSLAVYLHGDKDNVDSPGALGAYMATQLFAGVVAGFSSLAMHGEAVQLAPGEGYSYGGVAVVETLYTFMLCFVVLMGAVKGGAAEAFGLAIGFVIVAGGYGGGFISGGAFNPAVALGVDVGSSYKGVYWCFVYMAFEFLGAALAYAVSNFLTKNGDWTLGQKLTSEFLGTFFLVFTVGLNVIGGSPAPALSIAAALMCMIYALGQVSGAHFNPAVTLAIQLSNKTTDKGGSWGVSGPYMGAQLLGGLAAGMTYCLLTGGSVPLGPGAGHNQGTAAFAEIVYTFVLAFTVLNVACSAATNAQTCIFGLAIGFCIVTGGYAIGPISGGSLNPAVSFGLDTSNLLTKGGSYGNFVSYSIYEFVGAAIAFGAYSFCRPDEVKKTA